MKIKDLLKITGISLIGVLGVGLSIFGSAKGMTLLAENYRQANAYSVNEDQNSVTFSLEELLNCTYPYLTFESYQEYTASIDDTDSYIIYNNHTYYFNTYESDEYVEWEYDTGEYIRFSFESFKWSHNSNSLNWNSYIVVYSSYFAANMQKSVTLSASQLNNNTYEYFANQLSDESFNAILSYTYIEYNNNVYKYLDNDGEYIFYQYDLDSINGYYYQIAFSYDGSQNWLYYVNDITTGGDEESRLFTYSITIYSTYIANNLYAPYQPSNLLETIVALLTGGIVGFSDGFGTGISTLTTQIFISNNALSVFGGMIVVFAGISLAIGLCRWIMQFLTSLGAKK